MTRDEAIREVSKLWGVNAERKLRAISLLMVAGADALRIVEQVRKLSVLEGAAHSAKIDLDEGNKAFDQLWADEEARQQNHQQTPGGRFGPGF